jgi:hypothetical protein
MAAFVMAMAAGMAPGSGPEEMSAEVQQELDLRGEWEGAWEYGNRLQHVRWSNGTIREEIRGVCHEYRFPLVSEGEDKLYVPHGEFVRPGIYKWEGGRIVICISIPRSAPRPTYFRADNKYLLLSLRRAKPYSGPRKLDSRLSY